MPIICHITTDQAATARRSSSAPSSASVAHQQRLQHLLPAVDGQQRGNRGACAAQHEPEAMLSAAQPWRTEPDAKKYSKGINWI